MWIKQVINISVCRPDLPNHMADLFDRKEHFTVLDNVQSEVQHFISENILP
jgi:threonine synthase